MTNPEFKNNFLHNLSQLLSQEGSDAFSKILQGAIDENSPTALAITALHNTVYVEKMSNVRVS